MSTNVGKVDQTIRYVLAVILVLLAIFTPWWWLIFPAIVLGITAAISFCGLYKIFGFSTCKFDPKE